VGARGLAGDALLSGERRVLLLASLVPPDGGAYLLCAGTWHA
jgi:hypothetical protein